MEILPYQRSAIERARKLIADPDTIVPDSYDAGDYLGRCAFKFGYLMSQMKDLLEVAEELAGMEPQPQPRGAASAMDRDYFGNPLVTPASQS